ncbi:MAG: hypothetical protein ACO1RX_08475 [Candidatus Sericytochromatia bacterium]
MPQRVPGRRWVSRTALSLWAALLLACERPVSQVSTFVDGRQLQLVALRTSTQAAPVERQTGWQPGDLVSGPVSSADPGQQRLWVADTSHHRILQLDGESVSVYAGSDQAGYQDGSLSAARFDHPQGLDWDGESLWVADAGNGRIRRITPTAVSTLELTPGSLQRPVALAHNRRDGTLWIADAGAGRLFSHRGGQLVQHLQLGPDRLLGDLALDSEQRLHFSDNLGLWRLDGTGATHLLSPSAGFARLAGLAFWGRTLYLSDVYQHQILRYDTAAPTPTLTPVLGPGNTRESADGALRYPGALAFDHTGKLLLAEWRGERIRRWESDVPTPPGLDQAWLTTLARNGTQGFGERSDGEDLSMPHGLLWEHRTQQLLVADYYNHRLLRLDAQGVATPWLEARDQALPLNLPAGLAQQADGTVIISASGTHRVFAASPSGELRLLAGNGQRGLRNGPAKQAQFWLPWGVASGPDGSIYVAEHGNHTIRRIASDGQVSTLAGTGQPGYRNGPGAEAQFYHPAGLIYHDGALLVADTYNHSIRRVSLDGDVTGYAGAPEAGLREGHRYKARFYLPSGLSLGPEGDLFIADSFNHRVRKIAPNGQVSTLAGLGRWLNWNGGTRDGDSTQAQFHQPRDVAAAPDGRIFVADTTNHRIRVIQALEAQR